MKIKMGTVVVKVKCEMYVMVSVEKLKGQRRVDFTFKQGAANCYWLALGFPLQSNNHK